MVGADHICDYAAAFDVADEDDGCVRRHREAHVCDIGVSKVDFCGAARPLDDDDVTICLQRFETLDGDGKQLVFQRIVFAGRRVAQHLSAHHDLCADIRLRLKQNWIHVGIGRHLAGAGLQRLCAPDFATASCHGCIVRHVLRFEGPHVETLPPKRSAESGDNQRLAGVGTGPLYHDSGHAGLRPKTQCPFGLSRRNGRGALPSSFPSRGRQLR